MIYTGTVKKANWSGDKWSSVKLELEDGRTINAAGSICSPKEGQVLELAGNEIVDPQYGRQIKVISSKVLKIDKSVGLISYLGSGLIAGIREITAKKIVNTFKDNTLYVIENDPLRLTKIKGISRDKAMAIHEGHKKNKTHFELYDMLNGAITRNQADKIISKYGSSSVKRIKNNPYILIYELDGFGFIKADKLAYSMGIENDSIYRIGAGITYALRELCDKKGHCYGTIKEIQDETLSVLLPNPKCLKEEQFKELTKIADDWQSKKEAFLKKHFLNNYEVELCEWVKKRLIYLDRMAEAILLEESAGRMVIEEDKIYLKHYYIAECECARIVSTMTLLKPIRMFQNEKINSKMKNIEQHLGYTLEEEQRDAVHLALNNRICVITGGPGRGKTTIIRTILDVWDDENNVLLAAPTGKASIRMTEASGRNSYTIHRAVGQGIIFHGKLIIIDESSMVDIFLFYKLLKCIGNCNLVFVGDADQLESIGPGKVFRDLVNSSVIPTVKLTKGHRNSGSIALNSISINRCKGFKALIFDHTFRFIHSKENIQKDVIKEYLKMVEKYGVKECLILAPFRQRSRSGTDEFNKVIRDIVNPDKNLPKLKECTLRIGDRVMQTKNVKGKEYHYLDGERGIGVYNGDCGFVKSITPSIACLCVEFDDGKIVEYKESETIYLKLAYAMTVHKAQGSECKGAIIIHNKEHFSMLRKALLYTAVTRAKLEVVLMGEEDVFDAAIKNIPAKMFGETIRNTWLTERIEKFYREKRKAV